MITTGREDISKWASRIDTIIAKTQPCCVNRVVVVESTPSTMDAAAMFAGQDCGVLVVASQQTNGRGQRGRVWHDADRCTLPCTFVIDASGIEPTMLSAMVGCAVHETIKVLAPSSSEAMIKWPNDIVIRDRDDRSNQSIRDRKIAGTLIEQRGQCTFIGIGINCTQGAADWDPAITDHAVSLSQIGAQVSRLDLACCLVEHLSHWLDAQDRSAIRNYFANHDALVNTHRSFQYNNTRYDGVVACIDPLECIVVNTSTGSHTLPIAQTIHIRTLRADA